MLAVHNSLTYLTTHNRLYYLLIIGVLALLGGFIIFYAQQKKSDNNVDVTAIAGDDVNATQLDLAKAYLEMGQTALAKTILRQAIKQGSKPYKSQARQLLKSL